MKVSCFDCNAYDVKKFLIIKTVFTHNFRWTIESIATYRCTNSLLGADFVLRIRQLQNVYTVWSTACCLRFKLGVSINHKQSPNCLWVLCVSRSE